jgi:hypothetical protein
MASSQPELLNEVRKLTGYEEFVLDESELRACFDRARSHITSRKGFDASQVEWFSNDQLEEALFWFTAFLSQVSVGELDAPAGVVENIEISRFKASDSEWYQRAQQAMRAIDVSGGNTSSFVGSVSRDNRLYGEEDAGAGL